MEKVRELKIAKRLATIRELVKTLARLEQIKALAEVEKLKRLHGGLGKT